MKKILLKTLAIFTAAATGFSLPAASFAQSREPIDIYNDAARKMSELSSMELRASIDMNLSLNGETTFLPVTTDIKIEGIDSDDLKMDMYTSVSMGEQSVDLSTYYTDGYCYMDILGSKLKYPIDIRAMESQISSFNPQANLNPEDFLKIEAEDAENGTLLSFTIESDSINDILDSYIDSLDDTLGNLNIDVEVSEDIKGTALVTEDGYLSETSMTLPVSSSLEGQEILMDMVMHMEYVNPGQEVAVELPPLDDYEEIDMDDLEGAVETAA